jgi:hypothetical protein
MGEATIHQDNNLIVREADWNRAQPQIRQEMNHQDKINNIIFKN